MAASGRAPITRWLLAIRTVVIDTFIADAIHQGVDTVLNLGAGLDTRPYRLELPPDLNWIEVDFPKIIAYKESIIGAEVPHCHLERITADLSDDDVRRALLHDIESQTKNLLVITEGVTPYLSNDQVSTLATDLGSMKSRTWWINDYFAEAVHQYRERNGVSARMKEAPFLFRPGDWFDFFAKRNWVVKEVRYLPIEGRKMGRPFPVPRRARSLRTMLLYLLRPRLRKQIGTSFGFAMMERSHG